jgi:hypothetical protein
MKAKFLAVIAAFFLLISVTAPKAKAETITVTAAPIISVMTFWDYAGPHDYYFNAYGSYSQTADVPDGIYYTVTIVAGSNYGSFIAYGHYHHYWTYNNQNYSESADFDTDYNSPTYGQCTFNYGLILGSGYNTVFDYYN